MQASSTPAHPFYQAFDYVVSTVFLDHGGVIATVPFASNTDSLKFAMCSFGIFSFDIAQVFDRLRLYVEQREDMYDLVCLPFWLVVDGHQINRRCAFWGLWRKRRTRRFACCISLEEEDDGFQTAFLYFVSSYQWQGVKVDFRDILTRDCMMHKLQYLTAQMW
jgi:hypothetical protein